MVLQSCRMFLTCYYNAYHPIMHCHGHKHIYRQKLQTCYGSIKAILLLEEVLTKVQSCKYLGQVIASVILWNDLHVHSFEGCNCSTWSENATVHHRYCCGMNECEESLAIHELAHSACRCAICDIDH